jgi:hypothetical protein
MIDQYQTHFYGLSGSQPQPAMDAGHWHFPTIHELSASYNFMQRPPQKTWELRKSLILKAGSISSVTKHHTTNKM